MKHPIATQPHLPRPLLRWFVDLTGQGTLGVARRLRAGSSHVRAAATSGPHRLGCRHSLFFSPCCLPLVPGYLPFVTGSLGAG